MAELAEYQQWLRDGIKAGAAGDKNNKYLAHLAQYGEDAPFYGGKLQFGNLQYRANSMSNGRDIGSEMQAMTGAELRKRMQDFAAGPDSSISSLDREIQTGEWDDGQRAILGGQKLAQQQALDRLLSGIDDNKHYALVGNAPFSLLPGFTPGEFREVGADFDPSKFAGHETIRPGELDNFVNGVKKQYGEAFDSAWNQQIEPKLRKAGANGDLGAVYDKAKAQYIESGIPWKDLLKYDENIGLYAPMGSVKHVDDQGGGWDKYKGAWAQTIMAMALTAGLAAPAGAAAGTAASTAASAAGAATAGAAAAGTVASGVVQGVIANIISSGLSGTKLSGKGLATSALMGGLTPYANANLGQYITRPGTTALLETIRQAATNKGKVDPRLVLATTAGSEAAGWVGGQLKDSGIVGKFLGGVTGGAVKQGVSGRPMDGAGMALSGVGNTGEAGSVMAKVMRTYQGQQALRQYMAQRQRG